MTDRTLTLGEVDEIKWREWHVSMPSTRPFSVEIVNAYGGRITIKPEGHVTEAEAEFICKRLCGALGAKSRPAPSGDDENVARAAVYSAGPMIPAWDEVELCERIVPAVATALAQARLDEREAMEREMHSLRAQIAGDEQIFDIQDAICARKETDNAD